jgi:hypothetical protein
MKLKEQLSGKGVIFENELSLGNVHYQLDVYQEIHESNGDELEGLTEITGIIDSDAAERLYGKVKLVLCLENGQCIQFFVRHINDNIRCSGGFFAKTN